MHGLLHSSAFPGLPHRARIVALVAGTAMWLAMPHAFANVILVADNATGPGGDHCSLIDAIKAANDNKKTGACPAGDDKTGGGDLILLGAGTYKLTTPDNDWFGPNGLPAISSNITIIGNPAGSIIMRDSSQGGSAFRIFYIGGGESLSGFNPPADGDGNPDFTKLPGPGNLTLKNLTIENGLAQGGDGGKSSNGSGGGGLGAGGAIYNQGTLALEGVTLNGNQAIGGDSGSSKSGTSSSSGNPAGGGGMGGSGDSFGNGGGFSSNGAWPDNNASPGSFGNGGDTQHGGGTGGGGGGKKAGGFGGGGGGGGGAGGFGGGGGNGGQAGFGGGSGIFGFDGGGAGMGGAIFNDGGDVTILNSTLTGNNAQAGASAFNEFAMGSAYGGAVFNLNGTLSIRYSTLAYNTVTFNAVAINIGGAATNGGAVYSLQASNPGSPAANASGSASLSIGSSILYGSSQVALSSDGNTSTSISDCVFSGGSFSGNHNTLGTLSAGCFDGTSTFSPPLLLPLGNNGGPTQTLQLLGGIARDGGSSSGAPQLDQRGYLRDAAPDMGAYESSFTRVAPPVVSGLQDATVYAASNAASYPFTVNGGSASSPGATISVNPSDTAILPLKNITLSSGCGSGAIQTNCSLNITPPSDKIGNVTLAVLATDKYGQIGYGSFTLTVIPTPPVASDVTVSTPSNQDGSGVMKASSDFVSTLTYSILTPPAHGSVKQSSSGGSAFTYTADDGYVGTDSFTYKANDGTSDSNTATVNITVTAPIAVPGELTASDVTLTAYQNTAANGTFSVVGGSGQNLEISIVKQPAHGTVKINDASQGTFTYTPASNYSGNDSFTYSAKDTALDLTSNTATVNIMVNVITASGEAAPVTATLTLTTYAGVKAKGTLVANDAAGNPLHFAVTKPTHGSVKLDDATTGKFTYTPAAGYSGADSFTYTATDTANQLGSSPGTVNVTIESVPVSDTAVPLASDASFTTYVNIPLKASVSASDAAGNAMSYVLAKTPAHGSVTITAASGAFTYTPASSYTGKDSFTFTATDASTGVSSDAATVSLVVQALPPPPVSAPVANAVLLTTYEAIPVSGTLSASDVGGNPLSYSVVAPPAHGTLNLTATTGAVTYTPAAGYQGSDSFTFIATDTVTSLASAPATGTVTVNAAPTAPAAPATGTLSLNTYKNTAISGNLPASDAQDDPLSYTVAVQPANGSVALSNPNSNAFTYTPDTGYTGTDSFTFTATNSLTGATSAAGTVSVTVIATPVSPSTTAPVANASNITLYENGSFTGTLTAVTATGNSLTYAIDTQPAHGTVSVTAASGAFTYTPTTGYTGADSFTFTATDSGTTLKSGAATVTLTINTAPPAPPTPLVSDATFSMFQDQAVTGTLSAVVPFAGDALSFSTVQPAHGTLSVDATTGDFTYTPAAGYTGNDSFTYTALDTATNTVSPSATVTLTVSAPSLTGSDLLANSTSLNLYENNPLSGQLSATNAAGNPVSFAAVTTPAHGTLSLTAASGAFTYTPTAGYTGGDSFTFTATDTVTNKVSTTASVALTVQSIPATPPPVPPLANASSITGYAGTPVSGILSAAGIGNALAFAVTVQPAHGSVSVTPASGTFTYTPDSGYIGKDSFTFSATDTVTTASTTATVSIFLLDASAQTGIPPLVNDAAYSLYAGQPFSGALSAVDAAGNPVSYAAATQPAHGTLDITDATGAFTYTPNTGYTGSDSFSFTATDTATGLVSTAATIKLTVSGVPLGDAPPLASDANLTLYADRSFNGNLTAVDLKANPMSYAIGTKPANGTVTVTADTGALVYTPNAGYTGSDSFTFTATDTVSKLASNAATVTLNIQPAPPTPAHHGGPRGGGGIGSLTLLLLLPLAWRKRLRHISKWLALALPLLLASHSGMAQDAVPAPRIPSDAWYAGPQLNVIKPADKRNAASQGLRGWGLLLGKQFDDYSLEFATAYHADYPRGLTDTANWTSYGMNGLWYFLHRDETWFSPFTYAGLGLLRQYRGDDSHSSSAYLNLGIGFNSTFGMQLPIRLRVDLQLQHAFAGYNDLVLNVGIVFPFGGTPPAWQQPAAPEPSKLDEYPMAWCTQQGGHPEYTEHGWVCLPPAPATPPP